MATKTKKKKTGRGMNPNSLANLELSSGRPPRYEETKERHEISITGLAWERLQELAADLGCGRSVSEMIEQIGRDQIIPVRAEDLEYIDVQEGKTKKYVPIEYAKRYYLPHTQESLLM